MAWSTPVTHVTGDVVPAADWNILANDLSALNTRINNTATVAAQETTTSNTFADLATTTDTVTVTTGTKALVILTSALSPNTANATAFVSFAVSGATTVAASNATAIQSTIPATGSFQQFSAIFVATLTAGSNTFKMKYQTTAGTASFANRSIIVIPQF